MLKPVKMVPCGNIIKYEDIFPKSSQVKVLVNISDPFKPKDLPKGSVVIVRRIKYQTNASWVECEDKYGEIWNIRPKDLANIDISSEKNGRYRILTQDED